MNSDRSIKSSPASSPKVAGQQYEEKLEERMTHFKKYVANYFELEEVNEQQLSILMEKRREVWRNHQLASNIDKLSSVVEDIKLYKGINT